MPIRTVIQPVFILDAESEKDTSWPDLSLCFCKDTRNLYELNAGAFMLINDKMSTWNIVTRPINSTSWQVSTSRNSIVAYSVSVTCSLSLSGGQSGTLDLEGSLDNTNWFGISQVSASNTGALTIGLNTQQKSGSVLAGTIQAGGWLRIRPTNVIGTPTFVYLNGQETLF